MKSRSGSNKMAPHPVRFEKDERKQLDTVSERTGLPISSLVRLSVAYALPKLVSGEIQLSDFMGAEAKAGKAA